MKKFFLLATLFVAGFTAMAQQNVDAAVKFNTELHDFGKIAQGTPVTTFFTLTNKTDRPMAIESATAGCGCTTPEYSKDLIPSGGSTKIKVGYNAAAMGRFEKDVTIKLAGIPEYKVIKITGEVVDASAVAAAAKKEVKTAAKAVKQDAKAGKKADKTKKAKATK